MQWTMAQSIQVLQILSRYQSSVNAMSDKKQSIRITEESMTYQISQCVGSDWLRWRESQCQVNHDTFRKVP